MNKYLMAFGIATIIVLVVVSISAIVVYATTPSEPTKSEIDTWLCGKTFVIGEYDCSQYSYDAYRDLFPNERVDLVMGMLHGKPHTWIEVNGKGFEATNGKWIYNYWLQEYEVYGKHYIEMLL